VQATQDGKVLKVLVAEGDRSPIATIVKLELDGSAMELPPVSITPPALTSGKKASASNIFRNDDSFSPAKAMDDNPQTRWATDAGTHAAWIQADLASPTLIGRLAVSEAFAGRVRKFELQYRISEEQAWQTALTGTELGENFEADFEPVTARWVRLNILEATEGPTLNEVRLFSPRNKLP
jgi:alpha-L-fucosidase